MKSFLGNFYRHLAIFSGHTGGWVSNPRNGKYFSPKNNTRRVSEQKREKGEVVVAQLVERSIPTPVAHGSNPVLGKKLY